MGLVVASVMTHHFWADRIKDALGLGNAYVPAKGDRLRIVSWNLGNFPREHQDLLRLHDWVERADPDVLAVQEIRDTQRLRELFPAWELFISEAGGRGHQRLGFMWKRDQVQLLEEPREHHEITSSGRVRPAVSAYLRALPDGPDFHLIVVHLKARPQGYALRQKQWLVLQELVTERIADLGDPHNLTGPPNPHDELDLLDLPDGDLVILGDFNVTGGKDRDASAEMVQLEHALGQVGLTRVPTTMDCSAYWDGSRRDAWKEASLLDLVWVRDLQESFDADVRARPLAHCARHACANFRSTKTYPERDYATVSDHCPVMVDLHRGEDDDTR